MPHIEVISASLGAAAAFVATLLAMVMLAPVAHRFGLLDHPRGRKDHDCPTPVTGGIAILIGAMVAGLLLYGNFGQATLGFTAAAFVLIVLGIIDDRYDVPWWTRLVLQALAALMMIHFGGIQVERLDNVLGINIQHLGMLSVPLTVFATVGIINAINMIDGVDGLAGTLVLCALIMLFGAALYTGNAAVYQRVPLVIGAVSAFLLLNVRFPWQPRARAFLGNSGSAFLGLLVAAFCFRLTQSPDHPVSPVLALWLLPFPVMDCLVLMLRRLRLGRSPFAADRSHIHHLMTEAGFGPTRIALVLGFASSLSGLLVGVALLAHVPQVALLACFLMLCALWYWVTSQRQRAVGFFRWLRHPRRLRRPPLDELETDKVTQA